MLRINRADLVELANINILSELTSHWKYGSIIKFPDTFYVNIRMRSNENLIEYFKTEEDKFPFLTMSSNDKYFYVVMALLKALNLAKKREQLSYSESEDETNECVSRVYLIGITSNHWKWAELNHTIPINNLIRQYDDGVSSLNADSELFKHIPEITWISYKILLMSKYTPDSEKLIRPIIEQTRQIFVDENIKHGDHDYDNPTYHTLTIQVDSATNEAYPVNW